MKDFVLSFSPINYMLLIWLISTLIWIFVTIRRYKKSSVGVTNLGPGPAVSNEYVILMDDGFGLWFLFSLVGWVVFLILWAVSALVAFFM